MVGHGMWCGGFSRMFGGFGGLGLMGPILNLVISVVVIIGTVWLVIWIVRRLSFNQEMTGGQSRPDNTKSPLDILKVRYAQGEITRDEYQDMLADLK